MTISLWEMKVSKELEKVTKSGAAPGGDVIGNAEAEVWVGAPIQTVTSHHPALPLSSLLLSPENMLKDRCGDTLKKHGLKKLNKFADKLDLRNFKNSNYTKPYIPS